MRLVIATVLLAACGPRAVLGGRSADTPVVGAAAGAAETNVAYAVEPHAVSAAHVGDAAADGGVVISRLPAPHRARPVIAMAPSTPAAARALVGHRDPRAGVPFALDVAGGLTGGAPPAGVAEGAALVQWAQEQGRWAPLVPGAPTPDGVLASGDLVVFDRAVGGAPATLVAVVLGTDERGVSDLLYLARGVVRRGSLDVARPRVVRDREGKRVNSYVRHGGDHPPPGTRYLAGELASGRVRIR